tara:strand:- start:1306 stop:1830 length:525 start_codon:yes stop_codon:yes gene_type:complete
MKTLIIYLPIIIISFVLSKDLNPLNMFHLGFGSSIENGSNLNKDVPYVFGGTIDTGQEFAWGFDISGEGTSLSSTYGRDDYPEQAVSLNLIILKNVFNNDDFRIDTGPLVGFRDDKAYCDNGDSYLDYACYADATPNYDYTLVYGGYFILTMESLSLGLRLTDVSRQLIFGISY